MANIISGPLGGNVVATQFLQPFIGSGTTTTSTTSTSTTTAAPPSSICVTHGATVRTYTDQGTHNARPYWGNSVAGAFVYWSTSNSRWEYATGLDAGSPTDTNAANWPWLGSWGVISVASGGCSTTTTTTTEAPTTTTTTTAAPTTTTTTTSTAAPTTTSTTTASPTTTTTTTTSTAAPTTSSTTTAAPTTTTTTTSTTTAAPYSNSYSVEFDGTDDYASIAADSAINFSGDMTISAWVKFDTVGAYDSLVAVRPSSTSLMFNLMMSGGTPKFQMYTGGVLQSTTQPTTGSWYHVAVTIQSGVTNGSKMYVNGTHETTGTLTVSSATGPLEFAGLKSAYNSYYFPGHLDEIAIWDSELSSSNITDIYNSGTPDDISSLSPVGWWRMGENDGGSGTTITDQGSGGNDATLYNSPAFSSDVP